jgi:WD40 repeat protein
MGANCQRFGFGPIGSYLGSLNANTGGEISSFDADRPTSVSWSPDSTKLALTSSTIGIWNLSGSKIPPTFNTGAGNITWSPDGTKLVAEFGYLYQVAIFNATTGDILQTLEGHTNLINQVVWRPDSQAVASASDDRTVRVWDVNTGQTLDV